MTKKTSGYNLPLKLVKWLWRLFFSGILFMILLFATVGTNLFGLWGEIPSFQELENPNSAKASLIYSEDNKLLGKYFSAANRVRVPFSEISPDVLKALIATEDERFNEHAGIDGRSTLRVIKGVLTGNLDGGGSTISQQLAKNLFDMRKSPKYRGSLENRKLRMLGVKIKEWITAIRLETAYTKEEIITMYLNTVNHGIKANGIHSGAKIYFNKNPHDLNLQEAATLVGTFKANYRYDPVSNPEQSKIRRNQVFTQMKRSGFLKNMNRDSLDSLPFIVRYTPDNYNSGIATYFREAIRNEVQQLIGEKHDLTTDGIKIYTTVDYELQKNAEKALLKAMESNQKRFLREWGKTDPWTRNEDKSKSFFVSQIKKTDDYKRLKNEYTDEKTLWNELRRPRKQHIFTYGGEVDTNISIVNKVRHNLRMLRGSMLAVNHSNGHVKAYVGGINKQHYNYDMVSKGARQVGSTFKPILYSLAINNGYEPCTQFPNIDKVINIDGVVWQPKVKPDGKPIYLKDALRMSLNNMAAQLVEEVGAASVIDFANRYGINTSRMQPNLAVVLGTSAIPMDEIIRPYQTIANLGEYIEPVRVLKITDNSGNILFEHKQKSRRVLSPMNAYKTTTMLRGVTKDGTGARINKTYKLLDHGNQIAGKTGTTQKSKDCWFIGYTKDLAIATWVGAENNKIDYKNSRGWYGGSTALPIFANFLKESYKNGDLKKGPMSTPEGLTEELINEKFLCQSDTIATPDTEIE